MLRQRERALTHLTTAIRLRPGSHMNWLARGWEAAALIGLGRSREAIEAIDAGIALNPTYGQNYIVKALVLKVAGQQTEAIEAVRIAKRLGFDGILAERLLRRTGPNGSGAAVATIHGLYAAAEDVA